MTSNKSHFRLHNIPLMIVWCTNVSVNLPTRNLVASLVWQLFSKNRHITKWSLISVLMVAARTSLSESYFQCSRNSDTKIQNILDHQCNFQLPNTQNDSSQTVIILLSYSGRPGSRVLYLHRLIPNSGTDTNVEPSTSYTTQTILIMNTKETHLYLVLLSYDKIPHDVRLRIPVWLYLITKITVANWVISSYVSFTGERKNQKFGQ